MRTLAFMLLFGASLCGTALAHSELDHATPAEGASVRAPKEVDLTFGEPIEVRFSTFKVYPVKASGDPLKVNGVAGTLKTKLLSVKGDAAARADLGVAPKGGSATRVTLPLKPGLKKGAYVVMWKVLSVDTHTSDGYYVFYVK